MKMRKTTLVAAMALGLGMAGQAAASMYAGSGLEIDPFTIAFFDANNVLIGNLNPEFTFNVEDSASLDGNLPDANSASCDSFGISACGANPVLGLAAANGGGGGPQRADNDYSLFGPGSGDYANANAEITAAQLVNATPTHTQQVSEVELTDTATTGQASANLQSNTTFTMQFTIPNTLVAPATMLIGFQANPEMESLVALGLDNLAGLAQANMAATLTLASLFDNSEASWSPQGTLANDCNVTGVALGCIELADAEDLNLTLGTGPNNSQLEHSLGTAATNFGLAIGGLAAGDWTLTLAALTSVNAIRRPIPEPSTLLLLGGGLIAAGGLGRRRRTKKQSA